MSFYELRSPGTPAPPPQPKRLAVFVTHGMGQQVPFATLSDLLTQLRKVTPFGEQKPRPEAVLLGGRQLQRIVLPVPRLEGEIHFYEGYWAPLTEGAVTLRDVIRFLVGAGLNGIRNSGSRFQRYAFGEMRSYEMPIRTWVYLIVALLTVVGLVSMNTVIGLVAAARAVLGQRPGWLSDELLFDLTSTMNLFLLVAMCFGLILTVAKLIRRGPRWLRGALGYLSIAGLYLTLTTAIAGGIALPALVWLHQHADTSSAAGRDATFWGSLLGYHRTDALNTAADWVLGIAVGLAAFWLVVAPIVRTLFRILAQLAHWKDLARRRQQPLATALILLCLIALTVLLAREAIALYHFGRPATSLAFDPANMYLTWPVLIAVSALVRFFLVQYVGDVAAYVSSYTLDRFSDLRQRVKSVVLERMQAVYAADGENKYAGILLVGHSLGSVVTYDVLNQLINDDELRRTPAGTPYDVVGRTLALMTFGSPLDKTAFLFAIQQRASSEPREALATTMQPLIQKYDFRTMPWINIYSPWDIISGALNYYDVPDQRDPRAVQNRPDPEATTLLAAHTEYWGDTILRERLAAVLAQSLTV